jgi:hypothetical protein
MKEKVLEALDTVTEYLTSQLKPILPQQNVDFSYTTKGDIKHGWITGVVEESTHIRDHNGYGCRSQEYQLRVNGIDKHTVTIVWEGSGNSISKLLNETITITGQFYCQEHLPAKLPYKVIVESITHKLNEKWSCNYVPN